MSKRQILIILGIWLFILPFLGFPWYIDRDILFVTGLIIAAIAYSLRLQVTPKKLSNVPYVEHKNEPVVVSKAPEMIPPIPPAPTV